MGEGTGDQITQHEFRLAQSQFQPVCPFDVKGFLRFRSVFVLLSSPALKHFIFHLEKKTTCHSTPLADAFEMSNDYYTFWDGEQLQMRFPLAAGPLLMMMAFKSWAVTLRLSAKFELFLKMLLNEKLFWETAEDILPLPFSFSNFPLKLQWCLWKKQKKRGRSQSLNLVWCLRRSISASSCAR